MTKADRAIQQATLAVAVFDAGWPVPGMQLIDDSSDLLGPLRATIGKALTELDAIPAESRREEAAVGLRLLVAFVLAPGVLGGASSTGLGADAYDYGMYIASHVTGVAPERVLSEATDAVTAWLEAPTVQAVIRLVAHELERRQFLSGTEIVEAINRLLPQLGIHLS